MGHDIENRSFNAILKELGLKETPKRRAMLEILAEQEGFLSPEEIWHALKVRFETIGLPTVYRNLEELALGGVISTIIHPNRQLYYYFCRAESGHHHHFICTSCRRVEEIPHCTVSAMEGEIATRTGGRITSHIVQFNGFCRDCLPASNGRIAS
jgi:Fur family transcriptional regulator, ferric uptake regulator